VEPERNGSNRNITRNREGNAEGEKGLENKTVGEGSFQQDVPVGPKRQEQGAGNKRGF